MLGGGGSWWRVVFVERGILWRRMECWRFDISGVGGGGVMENEVLVEKGDLEAKDGI